MDDLSEFEEKIRKYIVKTIKENQDDPYFNFDEISSKLGINEDIVQETLKSFETENRIKIKYEYNIKLWHRLLNTPVFPEPFFRIVVLDKWWFERV
jgi:Mn-dependent DtxR family transcriptional regulator